MVKVAAIQMCSSNNMEENEETLSPHLLEKIVSGGQTGVDRAALDAAIALGIPHGGWCPKGRLAEDGTIPSLYQMKETDSAGYSQRTTGNIRDTDATLILVATTLLNVTDGTVLTMEQVKIQKKLWRIIDLSKDNDPQAIANWITENKIKILNIAGPRESKSPGIYQKSLRFIQNFLLLAINSPQAHTKR